MESVTNENQLYVYIYKINNIFPPDGRSSGEPCGSQGRPLPARTYCTLPVPWALPSSEHSGNELPTPWLLKPWLLSSSQGTYSVCWSDAFSRCMTCYPFRLCRCGGWARAPCSGQLSTAGGWATCEKICNMEMLASGDWRWARLIWKILLACLPSMAFFLSGLLAAPAIMQMTEEWISSLETVPGLACTTREELLFTSSSVEQGHLFREILWF